MVNISMANTSPINTRIILKNDELSNWNESILVLKPGEVALARREDGSYEMRIGNGLSTWSELGNQNFKLSADQVIGLKDTMSQLSTTHYETTGDISALTGSFNNGDTAVEKKTIGTTEDGKELISYTAYVYDTSLSDWKAMDGNYSAENVYFKDNITLAGSYTSVGNIALSSGTLSAAGKSMKSLMEEIFTKELDPSNSKPSITLTTSGANAEVGTTYTVPAATLKLTSVGSYTYGPATGITVPATSAIVRCTTEGTSESNDTALGLNGTVTLPAGATKTYTDGNTTYSYSAEATYTDGAIPVTNLGKQYAAAQIKSNKLTKTTSATMTGWRRMFIGSVASDAEINETTIKSLSYKEKASALKITVSSAGTKVDGAGASTQLVANAVKIIVALPPGRSLTEVKLFSASNTPITDDYKKNTYNNVQVSGAVDGANLTGYTVYVYQPASIDSGEVHNITIG